MIRTSPIIFDRPMGSLSIKNESNVTRVNVIVIINGYATFKVSDAIILNHPRTAKQYSTNPRRKIGCVATLNTEETLKKNPPARSMLSLKRREATAMQTELASRSAQPIGVMRLSKS